MSMVALDSLLDGSDEPIVVADRERVRFVILNRPAARNALTRAMRADFARLLALADADPAIDALVLTGAGRCFSGGVDLKDDDGNICGFTTVCTKCGMDAMSYSLRCGD